MVIPPEEEQPQRVTSPDGNFQIINHYSYIDRYGCYLVEGAVKYISPESDLSAEIKADYYDINGEFIDTEVTIIDFQESGKNRSFYIMCSGQRRNEVQYYRLCITTKKVP